MGKNGKPSALFGILKGKVSVEDLKKLREIESKHQEAEMQHLLKKMRVPNPKRTE